MIFHTIDEKIIPVGQYAAYSSAVQFEDITNDNLGLVTGVPNQKVLLPLDYVDSLCLWLFRIRIGLGILHLAR
jgi:hypothetical protein